MEMITDISLWALIKHLKQWLTNLRRASTERKLQSVKALRSVIVASRHTSAYVRHLSKTGDQDRIEEANLSVMWTEPGFALQDLGLAKLAKRCDINGKYWASPDHFDKD